MHEIKNPITSKGTSRRIDPELKHRLFAMHGGETLKGCYQCGLCTSTCPLAQMMDVYRPNKILELAKHGIRDIPFANAVLFCSACTLCTKNCPQGVRVHEILDDLKTLSVEDGSAQVYLENGFEETLAALGEKIPFPVSFSCICLRPSGEKAGGNSYDAQVQDVLRRFLSRKAKVSAPSPVIGEYEIAVIGSGPAGLTAAWVLRRMGWRVTVFESQPEPGGMLRVGIPGYRLPKEIVDAEIEQIKDLGVEIRTNTLVDRDFFDNLVNSKQYSAVFIASGASTNRKLRMDGESLQGVVPVLDLLRQYNLSGHADVGKKVIVIGGGNVAIDAARTALHCGAESVQLFCLESRKEMPAHEWEILEASAEGVILNPSWGPGKLLGDGQKVTGVEFVRCSSVFDDHHKFNPIFDKTKTQVIEADTVISAIGQAPDIIFLGKRVETFRGTVSADPLTTETSLSGVFAGGDAVQGTASLLEAIVAGRTAALSISNYLEETKESETTPVYDSATASERVEENKP